MIKRFDFGTIKRKSACLFLKDIWIIFEQSISIMSFLGSFQGLMIKVFEFGTGKTEAASPFSLATLTTS